MIFKKMNQGIRYNIIGIWKIIYQPALIFLLLFLGISACSPTPDLSQISGFCFVS